MPSYLSEINTPAVAPVWAFTAGAGVMPHPRHTKGVWAIYEPKHAPTADPSKHPTGCIFLFCLNSAEQGWELRISLPLGREPASHSATRRCSWAGVPAPLCGTHHFCGSDWFASLTVCLIRGISPPYAIPLLSEGAGTN